MICATKRNRGRAPWARCSAPAMRSCLRFGGQTAALLRRRPHREPKLTAATIDCAPISRCRLAIPRPDLPESNRAARRLIRLLRLDDNLALHPLVSGTASLAANKRVRSRLGCLDVHRHGLALLQFKAIFAEDECQAGRRIGFRAIGKWADVQAVGAIGGNDLQPNFFAHFHMDYRGIECEILGGHGDDARRRLGWTFRFPSWLVLRRACSSAQGTWCGECKQSGRG